VVRARGEGQDQPARRGRTRGEAPRDLLLEEVEGERRNLERLRSTRSLSVFIASPLPRAAVVRAIEATPPPARRSNGRCREHALQARPRSGRTSHRGRAVYSPTRHEDHRPARRDVRFPLPGDGRLRRAQPRRLLRRLRDPRDRRPTRATASRSRTGTAPRSASRRPCLRASGRRPELERSPPTSAASTTGSPRTRSCAGSVREGIVHMTLGGC